MSRKKIFCVRAVIFDMDGVITNTMPYHYKVWSKIFHRNGIPVTKIDVYRREGQKGIESVLEIFKEYDKVISRKEALKLLEQKENLFKQCVRVKFIPGTRTLLKNLHRNGFQLALVTGTARHELERILPDHLIKLFSVVVTGNDVRNGKPHPEPYLTALRKLKISSSDAVVVENAPFGIASAKAAGIACIALETSLEKKHLRDADFIYESVAALQEAIKFEKSE